MTVVIDPATVTRVNFNSLGRATGRADDGTLVNAGAPVSFNFPAPVVAVLKLDACAFK